MFKTSTFAITILCVLELTIPVAYAANKLLEGRIERSIDSTNTNSLRLPRKGSVSDRDNQSAPFTGSVDDGALQGGSESNEVQGGLDRATLQGGFGRSAFQLNPNRTRLQGDVSDRELQSLNVYDVVIMQDRSSSMGEDEHILGRFGEGYREISRWNWCLEQALDFGRQAQALPKWSFTLVLFSGQFNVYRNVVFQQLPYLYSRSGIYVGTKLAEPLGEQISEYFRRRSVGRARPLLIAVITDGKPQDDEDVEDLLIQATHQMRSPNEIKITFLQVGSSDKGSEKLFKLDAGLARRGAKYDIVSVLPFRNLLSLGLTKALVDTVAPRK